jgi:hypothetical protein
LASLFAEFVDVIVAQGASDDHARPLSLRVGAGKRDPKRRAASWFRLKFEGRIEQLA